MNGHAGSERIHPRSPTHPYRHSANTHIGPPVRTQSDRPVSQRRRPHIASCLTSPGSGRGLCPSSGGSCLPLPEPAGPARLGRRACEAHAHHPPLGRDHPHREFEDAAAVPQCRLPHPQRIEEGGTLLCADTVDRDAYEMGEAVLRETLEGVAPAAPQDVHAVDLERFERTGLEGESYSRSSGPNGTDHPSMTLKLLRRSSS